MLHQALVVLGHAEEVGRLLHLLQGHACGGDSTGGGRFVVMYGGGTVRSGERQGSIRDDTSGKV